MRLLCCVGLVVHEEEFHVADVVDEEGLVAGGHHVACLLVATVADLRAEDCQRVFSQSSFTKFSITLSLQCPTALVDPPSSILLAFRPSPYRNSYQRTFGITAVPLNRLLTPLSIPLGFLHASATRSKRSDW